MRPRRSASSIPARVIASAASSLLALGGLAGGCSKESEGGNPSAEVDAASDGAVVDAPPSDDHQAPSVDPTVKDATAEASRDASAPAGRSPPSCQSDTTFPSTLPVSEASAAAEVVLKPGVRELLIVGDSGHAGDGLLVELPSRKTRALRLPLDPGANDDLEGIAWYKGALYTLTSSGAVRRFVPDGLGGVKRDQDAYPLGAVPAACADLQAVNCGRNYEGLCLREAPSSNGCVGYAASKKEGRLYCLTMDGAGRLSAAGNDAFIPLALSPDTLSDCAFGQAEGPAASSLLVATNVYNVSRSYLVDEADGKMSQMPSAFVLNLETVAADKDGALYVMSDDNSNGPSSASRATCTNW